MYANTHTTASVTGYQSHLYRHEARQIIERSLNARNDKVFGFGGRVKGRKEGRKGGREEGREEERKRGREEERKRGREEGRKGGREGGRTYEAPSKSGERAERWYRGGWMGDSARWGGGKGELEREDGGRRGGRK
jgi:hypothetical protein